MKKYVIRNINTGKYLGKTYGNCCWVDDIWQAKLYKTPAIAKSAWKNCTEYNGVLTVELVEVALQETGFKFPI